MKWFWALVVIAGIGAVVLLARPDAEESRPDSPAPSRVPAPTTGEMTPIWERIALQNQPEQVADPQAATDPVEPDSPALNEKAGSGSPVEVMQDGSLMLNGRYRLTGKGTPDEPYTVTWELLRSAEQGYAPVVGKTDMPEWIEMLGGVYVKIDGFMMNPTLEAEVDEFLLMKNSWDECCLGLPPTPYDSIEVAMQQTKQMPELLHARASVIGRLEVKPTLFAGRFLTGLYTLEEARAEFRKGL